MSEPNSPKKSDMLEVRIPHGTKSAFMRKAQSEGRAASEIVRDQIDAYLETGTAPARATGRLRRVHGLIAALVVAAGAVMAALAISPASARADLGPAFASLDIDGNGVLSLNEFVDPPRAHEISLVGTGVPPGPVGLGDESAGGAYVRYILSSVADGEDIPLVVAVAPPQRTNGKAEVPALMEAAFHQLDRNGDGTLDAAEFGVH